MTPEIRAKLKAFNNALTDRPLEPTEHCYVNYLGNRGGVGDPIFELFTRISWSEAASVCLLSGQRGSGKSTELRRLRKMLEDDGCVVFLSDMRDYMNFATPVEISDFFISMMGGLSEEFEKKYGRDPSKESYWERIGNFLQTEIKFTELSLEAGAGGVKSGIKASLKEDPTFRKKLQEKLKGHVARVVQEAHEFAELIVTEVRKETEDPNKKVVFLVDSVEQIRGVGENADKVHRSVENLFSAHAESLHLPMLHVLYTIPPYLVPLAPGLGRHLGGGMVYYLPSVHIFDKDGNPDPGGLAVMRKIVECRFPEWQSAFSEEQMDGMARATGGDFRNFFRLISNALVKAAAAPALPVDDAIIRDAENHLRREMLPIAHDDMIWLKKIAETKSPELDKIAQLPQLARFFDTSLILNYRNGYDWYDVHPLLKELIENAPSE